MTDLQSELMAKGYIKHVEDYIKTFKVTDTMYQKLISDEVGKKYYINIYYYYPENVTPLMTLPESIQAEVQYGSDGITDNPLDVRLFVKDIDKIEEVFENIWNLLGLDYIHLWE